MIVLILGILLILIIILYSVIENRFIRTAHYYVHKERLISSGSFSSEVTDKAINIVQLSDLHNCNYGKSNSRLLQKISLCKPDIILLTGDIINKNQRIPDEVFAFFEKLAELCPCIYSLGNHELKIRQRWPERFHEYVEKVKEYGIIILDDETVLIERKGVQCCVAAYSSDLKMYRHGKSCVDVMLPECKNADLSILLSHDPDFADVYAVSDYDVTFCGHLHGGIVRIPGYRGVISTRFALFPRYDGGCYQLNEKHVMIVSRGLGTHTIKFRLYNRPELVHAVITK